MTRNADPAAWSEHGCSALIGSDRRQCWAETSSKTSQALDTCEAVEDHEVELGQQCVPASARTAPPATAAYDPWCGRGEPGIRPPPAPGRLQWTAGITAMDEANPVRQTVSLRHTTTGSERCRRPSRDPMHPRPVSMPGASTLHGCSRFSAVIEALRVGAGRTAAPFADKALAGPRGPWRHDGCCQSPSATPSLRAFARRAR